MFIVTVQRGGQMQRVIVNADSLPEARDILNSHVMLRDWDIIESEKIFTRSSVHVI
jgi:hypothetical protein